MAKFLTILLVLSSSLVLSQGVKVKQDSFIKKHSYDTIKANKKDTISIPKNVLQANDVRIILEENNNLDYFKYIFPILTLLLGIGVNKFLDYLKDQKQIKKAGERWQAELASLEMPILNQIASLKEFLVEHNKEVFGIPKLRILTPLDCEVFSSLDKTELIKYFQTNLSKDFKASILLSSKITAFVTIVMSNYENVKAKFNDYLDGTSSHTSQLTLGLQELMKEMANLGIQIEKEVKGDPIQNPNYKALVDLFSKEIMPKIETGDYDIYILETQFFLPLAHILAEMRLDERTQKMSDIASGCMSSIKGIKMEKHYLSENLTTLTSHFEDDVKDLKEILENFQ